MNCQERHRPAQFLLRTYTAPRHVPVIEMQGHIPRTTAARHLAEGSGRPKRLAPGEGGAGSPPPLGLLAASGSSAGWSGSRRPLNFPSTLTSLVAFVGSVTCCNALNGTSPSKIRPALRPCSKHVLSCLSWFILLFNVLCVDALCGSKSCNSACHLQHTPTAPPV